MASEPGVPIKAWAKLSDFNPTSPKQLLAYLQHKGYPVRRDRKTKKPTTNLEALRFIEENTNDPLLPLAIDARFLKKGRGDLRDNSLGADGRFHSVFAFEPDTGRLSSKRPNLMNVPQGRGSETQAWIANLIRSTIIADPGQVLLEFDWKAIEAVLTGWFAGDQDYMKLSIMDSHGFYTSYILAHRKVIPEPFSVKDPDLQSKLDWLKKTYPLERALGKQINLASGYGMQAAHLAARVKCSVAEAQVFLRLKDEMAPGVAKWKAETQARAHKEGKLTNPFGFSRAFFAVFDRRSDGSLRPGREANEALAFLPQSTGAAMLRTCLVDLGTQLNGMAELLVPVHDSILLQCTPEAVERVSQTVRTSMGRPWPELANLRIETDGKIGTSWGQMKPLPA